MIYSEVRGRCGNQMFLYAVSRQLEEFYGQGITFNFYQIEKENVKDKTWKDDLCVFNVEPYFKESYDKQLVLIYGDLSQKIVFSIYKMICKIPCSSRPSFYKRQVMLQPILNHFGIYDMVHGYYPLKKNRKKNQFVCGTYEDERFFEAIRDKLLCEFTTKAPIKAENINLMKHIEESESVCVSFRRGDFLEKTNKSLRDICNLQYYKSAIEKMKEQIPNARFFFFSDDIELVKKNCDFGVESFYDTGYDDIGEKMRLKSACKHFIMSNSTFCWWAQYLSKMRKKSLYHQTIGLIWMGIGIN